MANTTTHPAVSFPVLGYISRFFSAIGTFLVGIGEASAQMRQIERLQAMSDEQLAKRNIKREDIVQVVFSSAFWM